MKRILFRVFFIIFLAFVLPVAAAHYKNMAETTEKIHIVNNVENNLDVQNSDTKNAKNDEPPASPAKIAFIGASKIAPNKPKKE